MTGKDGIVNVSSVPQRSVFRYPGGKTWLIPVLRKWFSQAPSGCVLVEPFAGGGTASLTAVAEGWFAKAFMSELDDAVAAVWKTMLSDDCEWLAGRIRSLDMTPESVAGIIGAADIGCKEKALATVVRNRINHSGVIAKGAGVMKSGESGKGLSSRWYPGTIARRAEGIHALKDMIVFMHCDGFQLIKGHFGNPDAFFFIDPPYTVAGRRLYDCSEVDHAKMFGLMSGVKGKFLMTYDDSDMIRGLASEHGFLCETVPMRTSHSVVKKELLISGDFGWLGNGLP